MSVILEDARGESIQVNAWNWGVLHYAVVCAEPQVFSDQDFLARLHFGNGVTLSKEQTEKLFLHLAKNIFPYLKPGQRMLTDFSVTDEPDDGTMYRDDLEKNYSLCYEVLMEVLRFLHEAQAPVKVI